MSLENPRLDDFVQKARTRQNAVDAEISEQAVFADQKKYLRLLKEKSELDPIVSLADEIDSLKKKLEETRSIISSEKDNELLELAEIEEKEISDSLRRKIEGLLFHLVPNDPLDSRNIIVEIRPAAGGEEAALFAGDMFRMYQRFAEDNNWKTEIIDIHKSELGGLKECVFSVSGKDVYKKMKFESGVHRVQRVPTTESGGRIHTSTITIAILPEPEEVEIQIDPKDIKMDFFHSSGPGGQNVNKLSTAVRLTHIPSGLAVVCQEERSQIKNREKAYKVLKARLYDIKLGEETEKITSQRRSQVGKGDRCERIRTYNFPQKRVTDHRINFSIHRLEEILGGALEPVISMLLEDERNRKISEIGL